MKKYRDIIMQWKNHATLVLLANESQDKVHYAMPQKVMIYDGMDYEEQIRNQWKHRMEHQKQARRIGAPIEHLTAAEYLSRFRKKDRLIPIISLVFYYGSTPWDGPRDLYDMFQFGGNEEDKAILKKYLPNYKINLIDAERINNHEIKCFTEDLQVILTMLKYRHTKNELNGYINDHKQYFQNVDYETSQAIKVFLNMKSIPSETSERKETINMCEALQEMYDDALKDGSEKHLIEQVIKKYEKDNSIDEIADMLEENIKTIQQIYHAIQACTDPYTVDDVYKVLHK